MAKLKLDLHDIYNRGKEIDAELNRVVRTEREIVKYEANKKMCYVLDSKVILVRRRQTFEPHPDGTQFTIHTEMQPKGWLWLIYPCIAKGEAEPLVEEVNNLKTALEQP